MENVLNLAQLSAQNLRDVRNSASQIVSKLEISINQVNRYEIPLGFSRLSGVKEHSGESVR